MSLAEQNAAKIREAAFRALRIAGLKFDDPDLVRVFDLDLIRIVNGRAVVPPSVVNAARKAKPDLFIDAMSMSREEVAAGVRKLDANIRTEQLAASDKRDMKRIQARFGNGC